MSQNVASQPVLDDRPPPPQAAVAARLKLMILTGSTLLWLSLGMLPVIARVGGLGSSWAANYIARWAIFTTAENRCQTCPDSALFSDWLTWTQPTASGTRLLEWTASLSANLALLAALVATVLVFRHRQEDAPARRQLLVPVLASAVAAGLALVVMLLTMADSWARYSDGLRHPLSALAATGLTTLACGVLITPLFLIRSAAFRTAFPPPASPAPQLDPMGESPAFDAPTTNGFAIASFVLGLVGPLICGVGSILAIVFGHMARSQITRSGGRQGGAGLALAGLILGYVSVGLIVASVLVILALQAS